MPRTKTTTTTTTSPVAATLNDSSYPYPTPSTSPALAPTTPALSLKTPGLQQLTDSTLSLPIGSSLSLRSRPGQSILSQLLAAHRPGRASANDHESRLAANDVALSQQTFRPKEQQRRSILPSAWTLSLPKSTPVQGFSLSQPRAQVASATSRQSNTKSAAVPITSTRSSRNVMEHASNEEDEGALPSMLPSAWLESVLHKLTRTERSTASHYATLPRVAWQDEESYPRPQPAAFPGLGLRSAREGRSNNNEENRKYRNRTTIDKSDSNSISTKALSRRGSACELALGNDARDAFQKNKPRTLTSAALLSSIAPVKESLKSSTSGANGPSDAAVSGAVGPDDEDDHANVSTPAEPASTTRPSSSTSSTATLTTTRGRFTIESASPSAGASARTRTLSTSSSILPTQYALPPQGPASSHSGRTTPPLPSHPTLSSTKPSISLSPASPTTATGTASNQLPNSSSMSTIRSSSASCTPTVSLPPSPSLSPSPSQVRRKYATGPEIPSSVLSDMASSSSSDQGPNSITIPRFSKPVHQRTHSSSSIHSTTSSSAKRSQVIIPPPTSTALLQFASFSSISPKIGGSGNGSGIVGGGPGNSLAMASTGSSLPPFGHPRVPTSPARNNFRQLSIQIIEGDKKKSRTDSATADGRISSELDGENEIEEDEELSPYGTPRSRRLHDSPVFQLESPTVHPLDTKESSGDRRHGSGNHGALLTHQTMNRVYPSLDLEGGDMNDSMISYGPRFSCSSVSSTSSSVGSNSCMCNHQHHHQQHHVHHSPAYFRQRSLSATHIEFTHAVASPSSSLPPRRVPGSAHRGSWTDPFSRNPRGGYSSSLTVSGVCADPHCENNMGENGRFSQESLCPPTARSSSASSLPLSRAPPLVREGSQSGMTTECVSDVVVKKSATGRMFTVERERTVPVAVSSPTRCSRFIVMSSTDDLSTSAPPSTSPSSSSGPSASSSASFTPSPLSS